MEKREKKKNFLRIEVHAFSQEDKYKDKKISKLILILFKPIKGISFYTLVQPQTAKEWREVILFFLFVGLFWGGGKFHYEALSGLEFTT